VANMIAVSCLHNVSVGVVAISVVGQEIELLLDSYVHLIHFGMLETLDK